MTIRNSEGNPSIAGEARDIRCPHELILMQLVLNGALRILEDSETERSEALRRAECGRLQSVLDAVQEALYWANNEGRRRCSPRRDDAPCPTLRGPPQRPASPFLSGRGALRGNPLRRWWLFLRPFQEMFIFCPIYVKEFPAGIWK